eukprot:Nitzschia sp. Nitz4//scaffold367_size14546//13389//13496//NITZ4_008929-RA/size14546-exonerate_est2genome-gene-0.10-mRNA-1//1//CDS//3329549336//164//frame0
MTRDKILGDHCCLSWCNTTLRSVATGFPKLWDLEN